jgi:hypothetical protein
MTFNPMVMPSNESSNTSTSNICTSNNPIINGTPPLLIISPECGIVTADEMELPSFQWVHMVAGLMDKYFTHRHLFDFPVEIDISGEVIELRYVILPNILNALRIMEREKYNPDKTASLVFIFLLTVKIIFIID